MGDCDCGRSHSFVWIEGEESMIVFQWRQTLVAVASISKGGIWSMMRSVSSGRRKTSFVAISIMANKFF